MNFWHTISSQFANPHGPLGSLSGFIMSYRKSNIERNKWAVKILQLQADDSVLEVGFGPGRAIQMMSHILTKGSVAGIDHSEKMLAAAQKRNKKAIKEGRVRISCASVSDIPAFLPRFNKVLTVNSLQFWTSPVEDLTNLRSHMKAGGSLLLVHQPRKPGTTDWDVVKTGKRYAEMMKKAGFKEIRFHKKNMNPVSTICVMGTA
jgi:cyclopropane fatty-acyl-phospholipid synthase-like methyltransferase